MRDFEETSTQQHWAWSLKGVIAIASFYGLLHGLFRGLSSPVIGQDDVIANVYVQTLEAGYAAKQGPIYEWLLWLVQQVTGPAGASFLFLKYALLTAITAFFYLSAKRVLQSDVWAVLTAFSLSLIYQIGWNIHEGVTHTATLTCFVIASFWAYLRIMERGRFGDYVLFGVFAGLGMLSKHTFGAYFLILAVASMMQAPLRRRFFNPRILTSLFVALAIMSPYLWWLATQSDVLLRAAGGMSGLASTRYLNGLLLGLPRLLVAPIGFLFPLIFILAVMFPGSLGQVMTAWRGGFKFGPEPDYERLIHHMTLIAFLFLFLALIIFGIPRFFARYMHPFFLVTVIGLVAYAMRACRDGRQIRRYMLVMIALAVAVFPFRAGYLFVGAPLFCAKCRQMVPYQPLAEWLRVQGFESGTLMGGFRHVAGNMRLYFPEARIISLKNPVYVPPTKHQSGQPIVVVWNPATDGELLPGRAKTELERLGVTAIEDPQTLRIPWTHLWKPTGYRHSEWRILFINPG